jgi:large subunit ribosomal protein L1
MPVDKKTIVEALKQVREKSKKKNFTQSVELIINLQDIDPKKPEGRIQQTIELPNGLGKHMKICVIASGEMALKAKKAGADHVLTREELEAIAGDKKKQREIAKNYDFFLAEAPLMPLIGKILGSILGPRGKMPTPVPPGADIAPLIEKRRRTVMVRVRGQPVLHCKVGTESMSNEEIAENVLAVISSLEGKLKRGLKNISSIYLKLTMGQPVKIKP